MPTNLRLVAEDTGSVAQRPAPMLGEVDAARALAEFHQDVASQMPLESEMRGVVLRCSTHWKHLATIRLSEAGRGGQC